MTRPLLFALICCLTLLACKNDTNGATKTDAGSTTTAPSKSTAPTSKPKTYSADITPLESSVRNTICGVMIKTVALKDGGNLSIEYFKDVDEYQRMINNTKMNAEFFNRYWSTASRPEKVMALVPSQILSEYDNVENIDITIHTGEKTLSANFNRDKLADFVGESWNEIQTDWHNRYRFVVVNDSKKRKLFFDQFVTVE